MSRSCSKLTRAPENNAPIDGLKVVSASGWFAARPSGTEDIYKIYAESFKSPAHLEDVVSEAQRIVDASIAELRNVNRRMSSSRSCPVVIGSTEPAS